MNQELVPVSGNFMSIAADDFDALRDAVSEMGALTGVFLKHNGNTGEYTYGSADDELLDGSELAADISSFKRGYICWKDEKVLGEVMVPFNQGRPPAKHTLEDHGPYEEGTNDGWQEQYCIVFRMVTEPFLELTFKATGISKRNAVNKLMQDFVAQYKNHPGEVPIITIGNVEFESKAKGAKKAKKFAPVLKIVDWATQESLSAAAEGSEGDYEPDQAQLEAPAEELVEAPVAPPPATRATRAAPAPAAAAAPAPATRAAPAAAAATPARRSAAPAADAAAPARPARRAQF